MVSIIIVHYRADEELYATLNSIYSNQPQTPFEIIIVDNDEELRIKKELNIKYPHIKYIKGPSRGFGTANNLGAKNAKGEYLFFLNPDTRISPQTIDPLVTFLQSQSNVGIIAPQLLHPDKTPFEQQGCLILTPFRAIIVLSFINKIFPNNPISKAYWQKGWDKTKLKQIDVAPGTAFMISKKLYQEINGFDEHFFLYFEEFDLCKRIREKGYKIFISPNAKIIHLWGKGGTDQTPNIKKIYIQSRMYYFKKHYGIFNMLLVEAFARFSKKQFLFLIFLIFAVFILTSHNIIPLEYFLHLSKL